MVVKLHHRSLAKCRQLGDLVSILVRHYASALFATTVVYLGLGSRLKVRVQDLLLAGRVEDI